MLYIDDEIGTEYQYKNGTGASSYYWITSSLIQHGIILRPLMETTLSSLLEDV